MAGVSVTLKSAAGQEAATVSGKDGEYLFTNVQPGMYSLTFWLDGFKKAVRNGLLVSADRWFRADMQMQVAAPAEYVELPAASVAYDRPRATAATFTRDIFTATSGRAVPAGPCKVDK